MLVKYTASITFTMQPATGPNPNNKDFELVDMDGDRADYVNSEQEAEQSIRKIFEDCFGIMEPHIYSE